MKKISLSAIVFLFFTTLTMAQVDKAKLSLDIQARYRSNFTELSQYTWQRDTQVLIKGVEKLTSTSAVTIGEDGKPIAQVIEKKSKLEQEPGNEEQEGELTAYVESALNLVSDYVFMDQQQMLELFNSGTVSEINDTYQVQAFGFIVEGDNLNFLYKKNTLDCVSQTIYTKLNGDDVMAVVEYRIFDGMFMVKQVALKLPAKELDVVAVNSKWAKKL